VEWLLIAATMVAFGLALAMSIVAWRLLRRDRERSAARIEALEAMACDEDSSEHERRSSLLSQSVAPSLNQVAVASPVSPPVEYAVVPPPAPDVPHEATARSAWDGMLRGQSPVQERPLFDEAPAQRVAARRSLAVAGFLVVLAGLVGGALLLRGPMLAAFSGAAAGREAVNGTPLELLSLRHVADQPGTFSVTGLVQNPVGAREVEEVEAVLYLFDGAGQFLTTGRAALEIPTLGPGDQSAFLVRIPTTSSISRYRVGFRRADGRAIAHADRRGQLPAGTTGDVLTLDAPEAIAPAHAVRAAPVEPR
jgi:hypothetical protein